MADVNVTSPQQSTPSTSIILNKPINWKRLLLIFLALLLVSLVGVGLYLLIPKQTGEPTATTTTKKSTTSAKPATPSAKPDETAGWKTTQVNKYPGYYSFELKYPPTWQLNKKEDSTYGNTTLTLSKKEYYLEIVQAGMEGTFCFYPSQTLTEEQKTWPSFIFKYNYTEVETKALGTIRRARLDDNPQGSNWPTYAGKPSFKFCHNGQGSWGSPTKIGAISYYVPRTYNEAILLEMDSIIKTIKVTE